jgi:hypothetical protein
LELICNFDNSFRGNLVPELALDGGLAEYKGFAFVVVPVAAAFELVAVEVCGNFGILIIRLEPLAEVPAALALLPLIAFDVWKYLKLKGTVELALFSFDNILRLTSF